MQVATLILVIFLLLWSFICLGAFYSMVRESEKTIKKYIDDTSLEALNILCNLDSIKEKARENTWTEC